MTRRERIYNKFNGRCGYSGTILEDDWQIEHIKPVVRWNGSMDCIDNDNEENMIPVQRLLNHYKHSINLETYRTWLLGGLHERLKKMPKNPRTERGKKRKEYMLKIAGYFGISENKPFSGKFYFETLV